MQSFIAARVGYPSPGCHEHLEKTALSFVDCRKLVLEPEKVPIQIGRWMVSEVLVPLDPNKRWQRDGYFEKIRSVQAIAGKTIARFYPRKNEHNRERAMLLLKGGNIDVRSIEFMECVSRLDSHRRVIVFRMRCVPSMKTKVKSANREMTKDEVGYTLYLAFDLRTTRLLAYPYSVCGCYDGRGLCSHLLCSLGIFRVVQRLANESLVLKLMPEAPNKYQNMPVLLEAATLHEMEARSVAQNKRRKIE